MFLLRVLYVRRNNGASRLVDKNAEPTDTLVDPNAPVLDKGEQPLKETERYASRLATLPFSLPSAAPICNASSTLGDTLKSIIKKSSDCVVDILAPFIFGSLLLGTTATGIVLYGIGHVGVTKIAASGIFGLNEDAIDTLLEMIHMQSRLMLQLKWSWWMSVAGRYETRCQHSFRLGRHGEDGKYDDEPVHVHDHLICTDMACPFRHVLPHETQKEVTPKPGDQTHKETEKDDDKATDDERHQSKEHLKLETRRDWLRWLILGKDGNGSRYRERHHRHKIVKAKNDTKTGDMANTLTNAHPENAPL